MAGYFKNLQGKKSVELKGKYEQLTKKNVLCVLMGYDICGGKVKNYIPNKTAWSTTVNAAEDSMFGGSVAFFGARINHAK